MFRYLPEQASDVAPKVDWLHNLITDLSVFFTVAIVGTMLYFAFKYRAKDGVDHETPRIEGSHFLEAVWTLLPTVICVFVGAYGIIIFKEIRETPKDALTINVTARQWKWDFQYENGKQLTSEAVIPVDTPVKFVLTANDVLHSFFIPEMRVKADAIKGRYTYVAFKPVKTGEYTIFCTEYCGTDHSGMLAKLRVVSKEEFDRWVNDQSDKIKYKPAEMGASLYVEKGCKTCHSLDGTKLVGPTFQKIYNRQGTLDDGSQYTADENYIRESILNPNAKIVQGFPHPSPMPAFAGLIDDSQVQSIIAFMKTLDGSAPAAAASTSQFAFAKADTNLSPADRGKALYAAKACVGCHSLDGSKVVGPTFKALYGHDVDLADGSKVKADDAYLKDSILNPNSQIVQGFAPGLMPQNFKDLLSEQDVADIIEFIKSVK